MTILTLDELKNATTIPHIDLYSLDKSEIHKRELYTSLRAFANMIVAKKLFHRPDEKKAEVVYWFSPSVYQYMDEYGKVHFLKECMTDVFSGSDAAYTYYESLFKAFFPGFDLKLEKTSMEYDYKVTVILTFE